MDVHRAYHLVYLSEGKEWVSESCFKERKLEPQKGRMGTVLRGSLEGETAAVVFWNGEGHFEEGYQYTASYLSPLTSAPVPINGLKGFEMTYKTTVKKKAALSSQHFHARNCFKIEDLRTLKAVQTPFNELDLVAIVESVDVKSVKLSDGNGRDVIVQFPSGIKDAGVESILQPGAFIAVLNLELVTDHREINLQFGVRSLLSREVSHQAKHLAGPFEILTISLMDLDNISDFSESTTGNKVLCPATCSCDANLTQSGPNIIPCSDPATRKNVGEKRPAVPCIKSESESSKRIKTMGSNTNSPPVACRRRCGVELGVRTGLLSFFTALNVPVFNVKMYGDTNEQVLSLEKGRACVAFDPDHSKGKIAEGVIRGLASEMMAELRSSYTEMIMKLLGKFGFTASVTMNMNSSWFWINKGVSENRRGAKLRIYIFGDFLEVKLCFFSDIIDCIESQANPKSMFLSPNAAIYCSKDNKCPCTKISVEGVSTRRIMNMESFPNDCPILFACSGTVTGKGSVFLNGMVRYCTEIGARDAQGFEMQCLLRIYDGLVEPSACHPFFYCENCIARELTEVWRHKFMKFGAMAHSFNLKCCTVDCNEYIELYMLPFRLG